MLPHESLLPTTVVIFVRHRVVEVVNAKFSLEREFVVCIEKIKCECSLGPVEGSGVPPHSQQLVGVVDPCRILFAFTELDADVDDEDCLEFGIPRWARCVLVTNVEGIA